jgi:hypothetical protein
MSLALVTALSIMIFAAAFHLHWALGGSRGYAVSLPQLADGRPVMAHRLNWWRTAAAAVALGLLALALLVLSVRGLLHLPLPVWLQKLALAAVGAGFALRAVVPTPYTGFFKSIRGTRWARYDTRLYSPLFLLLGVSLIVLAIG